MFDTLFVFFFKKIIKMNNFRGDLSDILAIKKSLAGTCGVERYVGSVLVQFATLQKNQQFAPS